MNITIQKQDILDAVNKVKSVIASRTALPILSHILLEAEESTLRIIGTDLKLGIECQVDCTVAMPGSLTVSCQRFSNILSEYPDGELNLSLDENNVVTLTHGRICARFYSMSPEEYPPIHSFENISPVSLSQSVLKTILEKTSFAICTDQGRYNLTGLLFELSDGRLTVVATDGRRMSLCHQQEGVPSGISTKIIIPGKMINELERLLSDTGEVQIYLDEAQAGFGFNGLRVVSALIDGSFPNYEMIVPKKHDKEIVLDHTLFEDAVKRTRTMTDEKFNSVKISIENGVLTLKLSTPDVGEYMEDFPVEYDGPPIDIAFNPSYILDVLRHIDTEKVMLILKDSMNPGVLTPFEQDHSQDNYVNVIMPIRI